MYDIDDGLTIWVGDLNSWVNVDFSAEYEAERREQALEQDLAEIGDIALLSDKFISSRSLLSRGIGPDEWRWFLHEAEIALDNAAKQHEIENRFINKLLELGRNYAIGRYARWENLPYETALTAIYQHGIRALLYQYIASEKALRGSHYRPKVNGAFKNALQAEELIAYDRTSIIQRAIHQLANSAGRPGRRFDLDRDNTRNMLSLCRLHFAVLESKISSVTQLQELGQRYEEARRNALQSTAPVQLIYGRSIKNWKLRHLHPLTYFYPYAIRNCLVRSIKQLCEDPKTFSRDQAVNELALAHCEMKLMRQKSIDRRKSQ